MAGKDSRVAACVQPVRTGLSFIRNTESLASHGLRENVAAWRIISMVAVRLEIRGDNFLAS